MYPSLKRYSVLPTDDQIQCSLLSVASGMGNIGPLPQIECILGISTPDKAIIFIALVYWRLSSRVSLSATRLVPAHGITLERSWASNDAHFDAVTMDPTTS